MKNRYDDDDDDDDGTARQRSSGKNTNCERNGNFWQRRDYTIIPFKFTDLPMAFSMRLPLQMHVQIKRSREVRGTECNLM